MSSFESILEANKFCEEFLENKEKNHFVEYKKHYLKNLKKEKYELLKQAGISQYEFHKKFSFVSNRNFPDTINFDTVLAFIDNCKEISLIREIQIKAREKRSQLESAKQ